LADQNPAGFLAFSTGRKPTRRLSMGFSFMSFGSPQLDRDSSKKPYFPLGKNPGLGRPSDSPTPRASPQPPSPRVSPQPRSPRALPLRLLSRHLREHLRRRVSSARHLREHLRRRVSSAAISASSSVLTRSALLLWIPSCCVLLRPLPCSCWSRQGLRGSQQPPRESNLLW
jgi:hypothetical protein